jgi:hypothetical protein
MIYALAAGVTCSLLVQRKVTKRNTPQAARPSGPQSGREFSEGTSMYLPKTTHILCAAPAGFNPSRLPRLNGAPKIKSHSHSHSHSNCTSKGKNADVLPFALALAVALAFRGPL